MRPTLLLLTLVAYGCGTGRHRYTAVYPACTNGTIALVAIVSNNFTVDQCVEIRVGDTTVKRSCFADTPEDNAKWELLEAAIKKGAAQ